MRRVAVALGLLGALLAPRARAEDPAPTAHAFVDLWS